MNAADERRLSEAMVKVITIRKQAEALQHSLTQPQSDQAHGIVDLACDIQRLIGQVQCDRITWRPT